MNNDVNGMVEELRDLGTTRATPDFTRRVMSRLAARRATRKRRQLAGALATAAGLILVAGILVGRIPRSAPARVDLADETRRLQQEYSDLERDLQSFRASARETAPVLYLGGDDDVDLVLDLVPFILEPAPTATSATGGGLDPYEL